MKIENEPIKSRRYRRALEREKRMRMKSRVDLCIVMISCRITRLNYVQKFCLRRLDEFAVAPNRDPRDYTIVG